eukprot:7252040-Pyramimonas_sp.AAC.1
MFTADCCVVGASSDPAASPVSAPAPIRLRFRLSSVSRPRGAGGGALAPHPFPKHVQLFLASPSRPGPTP